MKKQNTKVNNKLIIMLIILDLLLLSVFIYSFLSTKQDKQTGEKIECYINNIKIDCLNFSGDEHFCNNGICSMNGVCPSPNSNMSLVDCINNLKNNSHNESYQTMTTEKDSLVLQEGITSTNNFSAFLFCYDPILSKKDNTQDWCERECRINNMTKIKYTSKGTDIICACKDSKGNIALKKVFE